MAELREIQLRRTFWVSQLQFSKVGCLKFDTFPSTYTHLSIPIPAGGASTATPPKALPMQATSIEDLEAFKASQPSLKTTVSSVPSSSVQNSESCLAGDHLAAHAPTSSGFEFAPPSKSPDAASPSESARPSLKIVLPPRGLRLRSSLVDRPSELGSLRISSNDTVPSLGDLAHAASLLQTSGSEESVTANPATDAATPADSTQPGSNPATPSPPLLSVSSSTNGDSGPELETDQQLKLEVITSETRAGATCKKKAHGAGIFRPRGNDSLRYDSLFLRENSKITSLIQTLLWACVGRREQKEKP
jgi:hypothetical protein